ncbi:polysaccharide deacetylase from carbohydrate esterase family CE10 protein [Ceratobasidium theobromae]|uniref:chitin deacetylase n=1 Tax=Ceratobasidium theobromae TaxID=1582974 RepID=A0A5N5QA21_9AGAM|nr:polysaccharide deacetylase from carbohydrate esterase family CE10 protein [Ceratobasidium theobromae]
MSTPPNASRSASNASSRAKRRLLGLEDPVQIHFEAEWKEGNPLFDWLYRRRHLPIHMLQLRKERESPYFHEYIAFSLRNGGGCFRIDRRQLPDENAPMDSIYTSGVEPYDTIEQITSLDHSEYNVSNCLVDIEFKTDVYLDVITRICKAIHQHPNAKVYTLQRYNCYFFAQTILFGTARWAIACAPIADVEESQDLGIQGDPHAHVPTSLRPLTRKLHIPLARQLLADLKLYLRSQSTFEVVFKPELSKVLRDSPNPDMQIFYNYLPAKFWDWWFADILEDSLQDRLSTSGDHELEPNVRQPAADAFARAIMDDKWRGRLIIGLLHTSIMAPINNKFDLIRRLVGRQAQDFTWKMFEDTSQVLIHRFGLSASMEQIFVDLILHDINVFLKLKTAFIKVAEVAERLSKNETNSYIGVVPQLIRVRLFDKKSQDAGRKRSVLSLFSSSSTGAVPNSTQCDTNTFTMIFTLLAAAALVNGQLTARQAATTTVAAPSLASTNPTAVPLSSIYASASAQPTVALHTTYTAGATPPVSGAPPLPTSALNPANYPALDQIPPLDSEQVKKWIQEVKDSGITIPSVAATMAGGCSDPANAAALANATAQGNCWWTCGGCSRDTDITTCPDKATWGLSFDDGPSPYTPDLLNYLDAANIKSTFFVVGSRAISRPEMLQAEYMGGHQLSVHTWSHPSLTTLTNEQIIAELGWTRQAIKEITGVTPNTMRPPYGDIDDRVRAISRAMGLTPIIWTSANGGNFDTNDWHIPSGLSAAEVLDSFDKILDTASSLPSGFIVLAHDLYQQTVDLAVGYVLPDAQARKFNMMSIVECLKKPLSEAYVETASNKTSPASTGTGTASGSSSTASASGTSGSSGSNGSSGSTNGAGRMVAGMVSALVGIAAGVAMLL